MNTEPFLIISYTATLATFLIGLYNIKHLKGLFFWVFFQVSCALLTETIGAYYLIEKINNLFVFNLYLLLSTFFLWVGGYNILSQRSARLLLKVILVIDVSCWLLCFLGMYGITQYKASVYLLLFSSIIIIYLLCIVKLMNDNIPKENRMLKIWVCIAVLLYYSSCIPVFGFMPVLLENFRPIAESIYVINHLLSIAYYVIIGVVFLLYANKAKALWKQHKIQ